MDLNRVFLIGNVTRDPESVTLPSGDRVIRFTVATGSSWRDARTNEKRQATDFHDVVAWGPRAELVQQLQIKKGARAHVEGVLHHRQWQDPSGQKRSRPEVTLTHLILLGPRPEAMAADLEQAAEQLAHGDSEPGGYPQPGPGQSASAK